MPGGGRGFTRPASLISLWSTAPFLLNNSVGRLDPDAYNDEYNPSPTVAKRLAVFNDAIQKMLWPEKREKDDLLGGRGPGVIDRTTKTTYLRVAVGYLPDSLQHLQGPLERWFPKFFGNGFTPRPGLEDEPELSNDDKWALIEFLKTF